MLQVIVIVSVFLFQLPNCHAAKMACAESIWQKLCTTQNTLNTIKPVFCQWASISSSMLLNLNN